MKTGVGGQGKMITEIQKVREQDSDAGEQKYWQETVPQYPFQLLQTWASSQRQSKKVL